MAAVACDRGVAQPTVVRRPPALTASVPAPPPAPADAVGGVEFTGPPPGCQPAREALEWAVTVTTAPALVWLYPHAFRDPVAGCANTTHALATMTVIGPQQYAPGESGLTRFVYEAGDLECGRLELGVILKDADGQDTMLSWRVINSAVDCLPPPPLPPPPPPSPPPTPPDPCDGPWTYGGANPFRLPNSGDATERAYVRTHVSPLLAGPFKTALETTDWTSDGAYPVVLVKSATEYELHVNVSKGQTLPTSSRNHRGEPQAISHVSRFRCE